ncbi:MAG: hypothetical protein KC621_34985 [Myxococcales bacterium]|nr:hypothetical protein [Myxococcales bacterium]
MSIRWSIDPKVRAEVHFFTGLSFSGVRSVVHVFAGGRRQGPELEGDRVKSCALVGPMGTRMVLQASPSETDWELAPWRAVILRQGTTIKAPVSGLPAVQIPDLDHLDRFDAKRPDPDAEEGFLLAGSVDSGEGWTYVGRNLSAELKCNVLGIRLDLV